MARLSLTGALIAASLAVTAPTFATDVTYDKLAYLTFTGSVQVPGVTLNAGTYRFRLTNPDTSRNVLQVLSNDGSTVYAMFHTIPDSRSRLSDDPTVSFRETPEGVPPAVKSLFYGGEYKGYEFVYPKGGPNMVAPFVPQPPITYTPAPVAAIAQPEPFIEPEVEISEEPVAELTAAPVIQAEPVELPRTASPLPFAALGGLTTLLVGLGVGLLHRRWQ
jgi:hypothetical protein